MPCAPCKLPRDVDGVPQIVNKMSIDHVGRCLGNTKLEVSCWLRSSSQHLEQLRDVSLTPPHPKYSETGFHTPPPLE